nr:hypothetical protein [Tanacetum cinerariifolium]
MDAERIKALRKEKVEKDQPAKKQKSDELKQDNAKKQKLEEQEEAKELKRIWRYTMLKNFDREDLEVLWKIVKDRFKKSQPKEVLDVFLWHTLKEGPEMDAERIKAPRNRTRKEKVEKDQPAKKQKSDELKQDNAKKQKLEEQEEAKELKRIWR